MENEIDLFKIKAGDNINLDFSEEEGLVINAENGTETGITYDNITNTSSTKGSFTVNRDLVVNLNSSLGNTEVVGLKANNIELKNKPDNAILDRNTQVGVITQYSENSYMLQQTSIEDLKDKMGIQEAIDTSSFATKEELNSYALKTEIPNLSNYNGNISNTGNINSNGTIAGNKLALNSSPTQVNINNLSSTLLPVLVLSNGKYEVRYVDYATLFEYGKANFNWNVEGGDEPPIEPNPPVKDEKTCILVNFLQSKDPTFANSSLSTEWVATRNVNITSFKSGVTSNSKTWLKILVNYVTNNTSSFTSECNTTFTPLNPTTIKKGHKIYTRFTIKPTGYSTNKYSLYYYFTPFNSSFITIYSAKSATTVSPSSIVTAQEDITSIGLYLKLTTQKNTYNGYASNFYLTDLMIVDLTEAYGEGNEPDLATCDGLPYVKSNYQIPGCVVENPPEEIITPIEGNGIATNLCYFSTNQSGTRPDNIAINGASGSEFTFTQQFDSTQQGQGSNQFGYRMGGNMCRIAKGYDWVKCIFKGRSGTDVGNATFEWNFPSNNKNNRASGKYFLNIGYAFDDVSEQIISKKISMTCTISLSNGTSQVIELQDPYSLNNNYRQEGTFKYFPTIIKGLASSDNVYITKLSIYISVGGTTSSSKKYPIYLSNFVFVNLSSAFGSGNEPSLDIANELFFSMIGNKGDLNKGSLNLYNLAYCGRGAFYSPEFLFDNRYIDGVADSIDLPPPGVDPYINEYQQTALCSCYGSGGWFVAWMNDSFFIPAGHKYYVRLYVKKQNVYMPSTSGAKDPKIKVDIENQELFPYQSLNSLNNWVEQSKIFTATKNLFGTDFAFFIEDNNKDIQNRTTWCVANPMIVDLTLTYGAGNEPTKEWLDSNLPYFLDEMEKI